MHQAPQSCKTVVVGGVKFNPSHSTGESEYMRLVHADSVHGTCRSVQGTAWHVPCTHGGRVRSGMFTKGTRTSTSGSASASSSAFARALSL